MRLVSVGPGGRRKAALAGSNVRWKRRSLERTGPRRRGWVGRRGAGVGCRAFRRLLASRPSVVSRLVMNTGQMSGAAAAGLLVAAAGAGWALVLCGAGMVATVPMLLAIKGSRPLSAGGAPAGRARADAAAGRSMLTELREG